MADDSDAKLLKLRQATEELAPSEEISEAVMRAVMGAGRGAGESGDEGGHESGRQGGHEVGHESGHEVDEALARLGRATGDVVPDDGFTEALMAAVGNPVAGSGGVEADPLRRLGGATEGLEPEASFSDAVMRAVEAEARPRAAESWMDGVARSGRLGVVLAAVAAAACVLVSFQDARALDTEALATIDAVEVSE